MENIPAASVTAVCPRLTPAVAPSTATPSPSTTWPTTVVSGSGMTEKVVSVDPTLPAVSAASTPMVTESSPAGTVKGNSNGGEFFLPECP